MSPNKITSELSQEDAQIVAWLLTGLKHETIRLGKKEKMLRDKELLILNKQTENLEGGRSGEMLDIIISTTGTPAQAEDDLYVKDFFSALTPQQIYVISAIILDEMTERETAKNMGISQQAVNKIKKKALVKLREYLT